MKTYKVNVNGTEYAISIELMSDAEAAQAKTAPAPQAAPQANANSLANNGNVDFKTAIQLYFKNYANFNGRASKSEFWWTVLFTFLCGLIPVVGWIAGLAFFIPSLAVMVRRFHDTGKSGAYYFMCLIPIAGPILLIIQLLKDSDGNNQYGPGPAPLYTPNMYKPM